MDITSLLEELRDERRILEARLKTVDNAIQALGNLIVIAVPKKRVMSAEARKKISAAMKARWAKRK